MPVMMNDPLSVLQVGGEILANIQPMIEQAVNFEDPVKRIAGVAMSFITLSSFSKYRK